MQRRLNALAKRTLTTLDQDRLCALAFLHDIGKAGAGFYSKGVSPEVQRQWCRTSGLHGRSDQLGHVSVVAPLFEGDASFDAHRTALGLEEIESWSDATDPMAVRSLWLAAISHHGTPLTHVDLQKSGSYSTWLHPIDGYRPIDGLARLGQAVRTILPQAFCADAEPMRAEPGLVHAFAGLVSLADWIGSSTEKTFFPYDFAVQDERRWPDACQRASEVLRAMRIDMEDLRSDLRQRSPCFGDVFDGKTPSHVQMQTARLDLGPLLTLEAETGSGKTEAALWRFKTLFEAGEVDALCFLLPTRVSATAIYGRLRTFLDALFPDQARRPSVVLAVPGYLRANGNEGERALSSFEVLWPDVADAQKPLYWAAENSKRYFAAGCVAGTIDQFLLSVLQVKHSHLRAGMVLRSLVVVDEVHASDAYMTALLQGALERHVLAGGHALLMSATLTGEARARLVLAGQPFDRLGRFQDEPVELADPGAHYPCLADARTGIVKCDAGSRVKSIHPRLLCAMRDPAAVAAVVSDAVRQGARVLVLRNTVAQAIATQQAIEAALGPDHPALFRCEGVAALHHGRYAFEDRQRLDTEVEERFGAKAHACREPVVLVGTQTLEISLDCDADLMITDIVPIDVLLQRLGRLHRHASRDAFRPAGCTTAHVVVLVPTQSDRASLLEVGATRGLGIGPRSAYDNLLAIEATWRLLEDDCDPVWQIPTDNRRLVEVGADSGRLYDLASELGVAWRAHADSLYGKRSGQAGQARLVSVDWKVDWNDSRWSDLGETVRTRLGLDGVDLQLLEEWKSPFGSTVSRFTVPPWMLPTLAAPPVIERQEADAGVLLLQVAGRGLRYDRLGLRATSRG